MHFGFKYLDDFQYFFILSFPSDHATSLGPYGTPPPSLNCPQSRFEISGTDTVTVQGYPHNLKGQQVDLDSNGYPYFSFLSCWVSI